MPIATGWPLARSSSYGGGADPAMAFSSEVLFVIMTAAKTIEAFAARSLPGGISMDRAHMKAAAERTKLPVVMAWIDQRACGLTPGDRPSMP